MEFHFGQILRGVLVPAAIGGGLYFLGVVLPGKIRLVLRSAGLASGFGGALLLLLGRPSWPFSGSPYGLWWAVLAAAILPLAESLTQGRKHLKRYLVSATLAGIVLYPLLTGEVWDWPTRFAILVSFSAVVVFVWFAAEASILLLSPTVSLTLFLAVATGASLLMLSEGSASLAQMTGAYCSVLGGAWFLSFFRWGKISSEHIAFSVLVLSGLVLAHFFYADGDLTHWALMLSPLLWLAVRTSYGRANARPTREALVALLVALLPIGWVIWQIKGELLPP